MILDSSPVDKVFQQRWVRRWARSVTDVDLAVPNAGPSPVPMPCTADWAWRPELWRSPLSVPGLNCVPNGSTLGSEVAVFHDCPRAELTLGQVRNIGAQDPAPFALRLDVFRFGGSFLSVVIDLPEAAIRGLRRTHLLRMDTDVETGKPLKIFARLNVEHGPNTERIVRELPLRDRNGMVEFDLAYTRLSEKRVEKAWVDLIFERPEPNKIMLHDVTFSRRPRASL